MLATNPVDPHSISRLEILGAVGPNSPWPRRNDPAPFPLGKFLGISALVLAGYVVLGTIGADAYAARSERGRTGRQGCPGHEGNGRDAGPGEFRLAPGNNQPQGVVLRIPAQEPVPGEFRLAPGNNQPQGIVRGPVGTHHPLHGAGRGICPGRRLRGPGGMVAPRTGLVRAAGASQRRARLRPSRCRRSARCWPRPRPRP